MKHWALAAAVVASAWMVAAPAAAQVTIPEEYAKTVANAGQVAAIGADLFGDSVNLYTGATTFSVTDVSLPGNDALPMRIGRTYSVQSRDPLARSAQLSHDGTFADWDLEIPHLSGTFAASTGWQLSDAGGSTQDRCSATDRKPPVVVGSFSRLWGADEYWDGFRISVPGAGSQEMMTLVPGSPLAKPTDGKTYQWVTNKLWYLSCLPSTANGVPGEAFLARAPDGTQYTFDWVVTRFATPVQKTAGLTDTSKAPPEDEESARAGAGSGATLAPVGDWTVLNRVEAWILPTRVEDRYGNYLTYAYDSTHPWRLLSITASDGRVLSLTYNTAGHIATVTDGTRTWTYSYNNGLTGVTLPDGSAWQIDFSQVRLAQTLPDPLLGTGLVCEVVGSKAVQAVHTGTIKHPSGATGTFSFQSRVHGRSHVPKVCIRPDFAVDQDYAKFPFYFDTVGLTQKTITGPGLPTLQWTYTLGPVNKSWEEDCTSGCVDTKTMVVEGPGGVWERHTFSTRFRQGEGNLLKVETGTSAANILRTVDTEYLSDPADIALQAYPAVVGYSPYDRGDHADQTWRPVIERTTTQQGQTFNWKVASTGSVHAFDALGRTLTVVREGTAAARTETTAYHDHLGKWILGQVGQQTIAGQVAAQTTFDASARPWKTYEFGKLTQTLGWHSNGLLHTVTDGNGNTTTYGDWYRGVPRDLDFADGTGQTAVVNAQGWITQVTDANGYTTGYTYDPMGRIASITYPTGDSTAWNGSTFVFQPVASAEHGIPAGHWRRTETTGNPTTGYAIKTTFYDAFWRPLLVREYDTEVASSNRYTATAYDPAGNPSYTSYPVATAPTSSGGQWTLPGVRTTFDALGRPVTVQQDSELGLLTTSTSYGAGFTTTVTNPRGKTTSTQYLAWDTPTADYPTTIIHPEGAYTHIDRDAFGKPLEITREATP